jgi:hypothetical protein
MSERASKGVPAGPLGVNIFVLMLANIHRRNMINFRIFKYLDVWVDIMRDLVVIYEVM